MPWPLYPQGNNLLYPWNRKLIGVQSGLDVLERRKFPCTPAGIKIPLIQPIA